MKKKLIFLIFAILLVCSICVQASAYTTSGYKWASKTIYYAIHSSVTGVNSVAYASAISDYQYNTNVTLYASPSNTVYLNVTSESSVDWDGLMSPYGSGGYYSEVFCYLNTSYTAFYEANKRLSVAAHEVGHALGLGDLGTSSTSLMNGYTYYRYEINRVYVTQSDDRNGVNYLYP